MLWLKRMVKDLGGIGEQEREEIDRKSEETYFKNS